MEYMKYDIVSIRSKPCFTEECVIKVRFGQFGATLRTILLSHIPGVCFDSPKISANNTVFVNEVLQQRVRSLPLIQSSAREGETYYLKIVMPKSADQTRRRVLSQEIVDAKGRPAPVSTDIPLLSMEQGQTIDFEVKTSVHTAHEDAVYQFAIRPFYDPEKMTVTFEATESYSAKTILHLAIEQIKKFVGEIRAQLTDGRAQKTFYEDSERTDIVVFNVPLAITYFIARIGQEEGYNITSADVHPLRKESLFSVYEQPDEAMKILIELCSL